MKNNCVKYFTVKDNGEINSHIDTKFLEEAIKIANKQNKGLIVIDKKALEFIKKKFDG